MPIAGLSSVREGRGFPSHVRMGGPLGSDRPQGAVAFSGAFTDESGTTWSPLRSWDSRHPAARTSRRCLLASLCISGGRAIPVRSNALQAKNRSAVPGPHETDFIFETADAALAVDRQQRIVFWNAGAETLLGFQADEVLGRYCHEILEGRGEGGEVVCQARCPEILGILRHAPLRSRDLVVRTKTRRDIRVSVITLGIPSQWQELFLLLHLLRDVTPQTEMACVLEQIRSSVAKLALSGMADPPPTPRPFPPPAGLTHREQEVLRLLASGASTHTLATALCISPATARHHIGHLLSKLGVHTRLEAVTLALRRSLL